MEDHSGALVPGRQVHGGNGADALTVQDDVLGADAEPASTRDGHSVRFEGKTTENYQEKSTCQSV